MVPSFKALRRVLAPGLEMQGRLKAYRLQIERSWSGHILARCIAQPTSLPIPVRPAGERTRGCALSVGLLQSSRMRVVSPLGSGRTVALHQLCVQWARKQSFAPDRVPILLELTASDEAPEVLLWRALAGAGFERASDAGLDGLPFGELTILIDGWEHLPAEQQARWQGWLCWLVVRYPAASVCVVTGPGAEWPAFEPWELVPPDESMLKAWLQALAPEHDLAARSGELLADQRLGALCACLPDVAVLAWVYQRHGLPTNRAHLYCAALDQYMSGLEPMQARALRALLGTLALAELAGTHAGPQPELAPLLGDLESLVIARETGQLGFSHPIIATFFAALQLAESDMSEPVRCDAAWRDVLALAAGLLDDPRPLYEACRRSASPREDVILALGMALWENRSSVQGWTELILLSLAQLATLGCAQSEVAAALLDDLSDVLETSLSRARGGGEKAQGWALQVLRLLPAPVATAHLPAFVVDAQVKQAFRCKAAELLQAQPEQEIMASAELLSDGALDPTGRLLATAILAQSGLRGRQELGRLHQRGVALFPALPEGLDRRILTSSALALLDDPAVPVACKQQAIVALSERPGDATMALFKACTAPDGPVRAAARQSLIRGGERLACQALARLALDPAVRYEARSEALETLQALADPLVVLVMRQALRTPSIQLVDRVKAASCLATRGADGAGVLHSLLSDETLQPVLRAHCATLLGSVRSAGTLPALVALARAPQTIPLRGAAALALGQLRGQEALAALLAIIKDSQGDLDSRLAVIQALSGFGNKQARTALRDLLLRPLEEQLRSEWVAVMPPAALHQQPEAWVELPLPEHFQWRLAAALARGETGADNPSCLSELVTFEAQQLREAAIKTLVQMGSAPARQVLAEALCHQHAAVDEERVALGLASLEGGAELSMMLAQPGSSSAFLAIAQALIELPCGVEVLGQYLEQAQGDHVACGLIVDLLGTIKDEQAVPILERIVFDDRLPAFLRSQAVLGLSGYHNGLVEKHLLTVISDELSPMELRAAAITAAGPCYSSSESFRDLLWTLATRRRLPTEVTIAVLRVLGGSGDRNVVGLLLQFLQSEEREVAMVAADQLGRIKDQQSVPALVSLALASHVAHPLRLSAIKALLQISPTEFIDFIRPYLEQGPTPLRYTAFDVLLDALPYPGPAERARLLQRDWPLSLRLRLLRALLSRGQSDDLAMVMTMLADPSETIQARCIAAQGLAAAGYLPALDLLVNLACSSETPASLRRRVVVGLGSFSDQEALAALSGLADSADAAIRGWAYEALHCSLTRRHVDDQYDEGPNTDAQPDPRSARGR